MLLNYDPGLDLPHRKHRFAYPNCYSEYMYLFLRAQFWALIAAFLKRNQRVMPARYSLQHQLYYFHPDYLRSKYDKASFCRLKLSADCILYSRLAFLKLVFCQQKRFSPIWNLAFLKRNDIEIKFSIPSAAGKSFNLTHFNARSWYRSSHFLLCAYHRFHTFNVRQLFYWMKCHQDRTPNTYSVVTFPDSPVILLIFFTSVENMRFTAMIENFFLTLYYILLINACYLSLSLNICDYLLLNDYFPFNLLVANFLVLFWTQAFDFRH